ncbi:MAG: DISARM system phospholipase D-like protein DrmC [Acidimicrobiales bacterium]
MSDLAAAVAAAATSLSDAHVRALAAAYRSAGGFTDGHADRARSAVPSLHHREVDRVNRAWAAEPGVPGSALTVAFEAVEVARRSGDHASVEVVVTGPDSPAAPVRLTSEVVRQLIDGASKRVTMVSFAAYRIGSVIAALDAAAGRGVDVSLVLESPELLDGGGGALAYASYRIYEWPVERRQPSDAKLHAKAVIVDSRYLLLTSANMTGAAYDRNIELGVLCRGGGVATQVQRHFDALIARGVLRAIDRGRP